MATSREYFDKNTFLEFGTELSLTTPDGELRVPVKIAHDFDGGSKHVRIFIPESEHPDAILATIVTNLDVVGKAADGVRAAAGFAGCNEKIDSSGLLFTGRLLVYTPSVIDEARWQHLKNQLLPQGLHLLVRDGEYAKVRNSHETPLAFISHDTRDKGILVRELASKLSSMLCPVWYDEYSLVPGPSLRKSIERGLKTCPKCIVILSKNFFSNPGWTKREFDTIYTREILDGKRMMIPVWLGVTKQEVYDYSPILLDTVGINADLGLDEVTRRLFNALTTTAA